jgi:cytochrome P450
MSARAAYPFGSDVSPDALERDPHPTLALLREHEPVSWVDALDGWLVTRYDLALIVMRDPVTFTVDDERFSTARVIGPSMLSLDGSAHARHRAPFVAPFRPAAVRERFARATEAECARLLDGLAPLGSCEIRTQFAGPLAAGVLTRALGLEPDEVDVVRGWYEAIVAAVTAMTAGLALPEEGRSAYAALAARLTEVIATGGEDSLLAEAAVSAGGTLSAGEVAANAAVLLFGGIETTEGMIANALLALLREERALSRVLGRDGVDSQALDAALEESLRLEPAASVVDRYATANTRLGDAEIGEGELVRVSLAGAGRDPAVFADPDRFDLDRDRPRRHLAFAQGPHVCVGVHLARLEARTALAAVLERLLGLGLDPARPAEVRGLVFRKPPALWVRWDASCG